MDRARVAPFPFFVTVKVALSPTGIVMRAAIILSFRVGRFGWFAPYYSTSAHIGRHPVTGIGAALFP